MKTYRGPTASATAPPGTDEPEDERDESLVKLRGLPDRFSYLYDFGDG